jgi:hypothetical protein
VVRYLSNITPFCGAEIVTQPGLKVASTVTVVPLANDPVIVPLGVERTLMPPGVATRRHFAPVGAG